MSFSFQGLIVKSRMEMLQHFKRPWAHDHEPVQELVNAVKVVPLFFLLYPPPLPPLILPLTILVLCQSIKPTVLIGSSGAGRTFTKEVVQAMATFNEVR